ncbi:thymidylate synthase [Acidicapsa dinghuensis]|uniref:thymidylate synthase n=1 Tax=Acidicapsa dinghuensis TaxID=2218256 RepID=A0ABW1EH13_9BACT|nr:thymidylate synthase [Acidicapsa dinghuensis]
MKVVAATLDDLLHEVFRRLLATGRPVVASRGPNLEKTGALLELINPRARMSRTESRCLLFSALGELLWYLSGSNDLAFIKYYIPDYPEDGPGISTVRAAYGPRFEEKIDWVIDALRAKPNSRRIVIPIYEPIDCNLDHAEVPCTCTLQFLLHDDRLELLAHMRSNDAFKGLPGDIFSFTMIQELVGRALGVEIGRYKHFVGSLHLYDEDQQKARNFIDEGWQSKASMPLMPLGDQRPNLGQLLILEEGIRNGLNPETPTALPDYWKNLAYLLKIYRADRDKAPAQRVRTLRAKMSNLVFAPYIDKRQRSAEKRDAELPRPTPTQLFTNPTNE